jgi:formylglycine-generating enzyme required for sulfatase activity
MNKGLFNLAQLGASGHYRTCLPRPLAQMKTFLCPLSLFLVMASLISPLTGQSVSKLELEKSSALNVWEKVTITPDMVSSTGELLVPSSGSSQFYRMKVRLLQAPSISTPPPATTGIEEGEAVIFTVDSQGEGLTYQWYRGQSGDTSQAIQGATSQTYNTGALAEDTSYWVKVTNDAGSINSETVAVIINRPPTISSQPTSQSIYTGSTALLTVSATGSAPFTYQWYRGNLGATTAPVGTNSPTFTTPALTATTKYWVKITNIFGEANSSLVTVTVQANTAPTISDIAAQSITVSSNTGALAFTIGDAQTAASSLTLSGSSSNTTLVPNASIVFGGSGANRTVTMTPASAQSGTATITVTVSDGSLTASDTFVLTVAEFVYVAAGTLPSSYPLSGRSVAAFYIAKTETTWGKWQSVRTYAAANGYDIGSAGAGNGTDYPVTNVSWFQVVKWCNARSEQEGLTPVYKVNNQVYKTGDSAPTMDATANGYSLPTDAQWEFAARGGVRTQNYEYSGSNDINAVAWYADNSGGTTHAVGTKLANELGVSDMSGNVWEWCESWYPGLEGSYRVGRGGGFPYSAGYCPVAAGADGGGWNFSILYSFDMMGFRVVRISAP